MTSAPDLELGARPCAGCLGTTVCWVCVGRGSVRARDGSLVPCAKCSGYALCAVCHPLPVPRQERLIA